MKSNHLRTILLAASLLSSFSLFAQDPTMPSPSQGQMTPSLPRPGAPNSMQDSGPNAGDLGQIMKDKIFLRKAAAGGIAEVQLGQLAAQKAGSDDVKAFGQTMVDDHTRLNSEMAPIADAMGVRLPKTMDKEDQAEYDKLSGLSGNDFDTEYLSVMVKDHHKDLHEFRNEAVSTTDPTLRDAVQKGETVIREHVMMVDKLARDKGVPLPSRGQGRKTSGPTS